MNSPPAYLDNGHITFLGELEKNPFQKSFLNQLWLSELELRLTLKYCKSLYGSTF